MVAKFLKMSLVLCAVLRAVAVCGAAPANMAPGNILRTIADSSGDVHAVKVGGETRLCVQSSKKTVHRADFKAWAPLKGTVSKGDLIVVTFGIRGKAAFGDAAAAVEIGSWTPAGSGDVVLSEEVQAPERWKMVRYAEPAPSDFSDGGLRIVFSLGLERQSVEIRDLTVLNFGSLEIGELPAMPELKDVAKYEYELSVPTAEALRELPELTEGQIAKRRFVMLVFEGVSYGGSGRFPNARESFVGYLSANEIPAAFCVNGKDIAEAGTDLADRIRRNAYQNGGLFEFCHHGWSGVSPVEYGGRKYNSEYEVPDVRYQREIFEKTQKAFREKTGLPLRTFCPSSGSWTESTLEVVGRSPEIVCWVYGNSKTSGGKLVLGHTVDLESKPGKVDYNDFVSSYELHRNDDFMVLSGSPLRWNEASFGAFRNIIDTLSDDGWIFSTPSQFADSVSEPESKGGGMFPFVMGGSGPNRGAADVSWLNASPIDEGARIRAEDGHFVTANGKRVRFMATNFTFSSVFPEKDDAVSLAARLASMGINCVRMHHFDRFAAPSGIWKKGGEKLNEFDPEQLDKLDFFVSELKKNGIYVDLNLHVSRNYWEGAVFNDGLSDASRQKAMPKYGKGLDKLNRQMIDMQKDYARRLLTHVNPYTGMSYASDPCVAIVEFNNENTVFDLKVRQLPEYYMNDIVSLWNKWLSERYSGTEALRKAWGAAEPLGEELITARPEAEGAQFVQISSDSPDSVSAKLVSQPTHSWNAQVQWRDLSLENGSLYTLSFEARSDVDRKVRSSLRRQVEDWRVCGYSDTISVDPVWKRFEMVFVAENSTKGQTRLDFVLGGTPLGLFEIRNLSLRRGGIRGLHEGESLEDGTVGLSGNFAGHLSRRGEDWYRFLAESERAYADEMRSLIRGELKCEAMLIDSQASYGGMSGVFRECGSDFIDMHRYWQHPRFPGKGWDMGDWIIANTSMAASPKDGANLGFLARMRVAGKPFTVSEYDHPAPNLYAAEMFPMISTYASVQDWDGIFQFDWGGPGVDAGYVNSFFSMQNHPAKLAFLPGAAVLFRMGCIEPAAGFARLIVPSGDMDAFAAGHNSVAGVWEAAGLESQDCLGRRLEISFDAGAGGPSLVRGGEAGNVIRWQVGEPYCADGEFAKALAGKCGGRTFDLDGVKLTFRETSPEFSSVLLVAMDGRRISDSGRLLLTAASEVENTDMEWNSSRTSVGRKWGRSPTICRGVAAGIALKTQRTDLKVYALDGKGGRKAEVESKIGDGMIAFDADPSYETLWYEISAVEK